MERGFSSLLENLFVFGVVFDQFRAVFKLASSSGGGVIDISCQKK